MKDSFNSKLLKDGTTEVLKEGDTILVYFRHNIKLSTGTYEKGKSYTIPLDTLKTLFPFVDTSLMKKLNFKTKTLCDIECLTEEDREAHIDSLKGTV